MASKKVTANARRKKKATNRVNPNAPLGAQPKGVQKAARAAAKAGKAASAAAQRGSNEARAKAKVGKQAGKLVNDVATKGRVGKGRLTALAKAARLPGGKPNLRARIKASQEAAGSKGTGH